MSNLAKILFAVNAVILAALASPDVLAIVASHPKLSVAFTVVSNIAHLVAQFKDQK
jgi:hypothetical protein